MEKPRRAGGKPQPDDGVLPSPRDCMRTRGTGRACDKCGDRPLVIHVPLRLRGQWCPSHCPVCSPQPKPEGDG